jgi:hypothetical protein
MAKRRIISTPTMLAILQELAQEQQKHLEISYGEATRE